MLQSATAVRFFVIYTISYSTQTSSSTTGPIQPSVLVFPSLSLCTRNGTDPIASICISSLSHSLSLCARCLRFFVIYTTSYLHKYSLYQWDRSHRQYLYFLALTLTLTLYPMRTFFYYIYYLLFYINIVFNDGTDPITDICISSLSHSLSRCI